MKKMIVKIKDAFLSNGSAVNEADYMNVNAPLVSKGLSIISLAIAVLLTLGIAKSIFDAYQISHAKQGSPERLIGLLKASYPPVLRNDVGGDEEIRNHIGMMR